MRKDEEKLRSEEMMRWLREQGHKPDVFKELNDLLGQTSQRTMDILRERNLL